MNDKDHVRFGQIGNQLFDHLAECEGLTPGEALVACSFLIGIIMANSEGINSVDDAGARLKHVADVVLSVYANMADQPDETKH